MKDMLAAMILLLLVWFCGGWWNPRVVVQHGSAAPDTIVVRMLRGVK